MLCIAVNGFSRYSGDMFVKITTSGSRQYVKLVEAFRDAAGASRQRVIATLGRIEAVRAGEADALVNGRCRSILAKKTVFTATFGRRYR